MKQKETNPNVFITVTDELGVVTTIDTQQMGPEHPLGDHVLSAMHRLQNGFRPDLDRCMQEFVKTINQMSRITETLRTVLDQPTQDPDLIDTVDFGDDTKFGGPIDETVEKLTADEFDGSQPHEHDNAGWCVDERGGNYIRANDEITPFWHHDDHDGDEPVVEELRPDETFGPRPREDTTD